MITILAEKPSVAREIARIAGATRKEEGFYTGNGYHVTWALGHLVQPALPEGYGFKGFSRDSLPVIPEEFMLIPRQVKTDKGYKADAAAVKQIKVITKLWNESDGIIVATDCAREGELIFRYLYAYTGCTLPFRRLWISSLTDTAIRKGLKELKDGHEYDDLYLAAKARSEADWLVGINGTQALTVAAGRGTYSVGRVQTPTLGMVCKRYWENRRFTPEPVHQLHFSVTLAGTDTVVKFSSVKKWHEKEEAAASYNKVKAKMCATVTKVEKKEKVENPPLLYDLTTLQKEANTKHGFTAEQTLELVREGEFDGAVYTIRYFQFYGKGTLKLDNGLVFQPNDRYLLENEKFRLYYTSECDESQSLTITVEDNFRNSFEWETDFNNDSDAEEASSGNDTLNTVKGGVYQ